MPLILVGAPLGNPGDASARLREVLASADVVAAEDTRRLTRLARDLDITVTGRMSHYFEGNEERRTPELVAALERRRDRRGGHRRRHAQRLRPRVPAGPSGPRGRRAGHRRARAERGHHRAGAVRAAQRPVLLRGLPAPQAGRAAGPVRPLAAEPRTLVFFEAPHRIAGTLADLAAAFGADRPAALCRELTKTYEEVRRPPARRAGRPAREDGRGRDHAGGGRGAGGRRPPAGRRRPARRGGRAGGRPAVPRGTRSPPSARRYGLPRREVYAAVVVATARGSSGPGG